MTLSVVMITYNSAEVVEGAIQSIEGMWDELLVGDGGSTDGTVEMVKRYGGKIIRPIQTNPTNLPITKNLGERKQELVERAKGEWILVLDADERVSEELKAEIGRLGDRKRGREVAFRIPYQNYVFGEPVYYGGERYAKVRLFRKGFGRISSEALHEEVRVVGPTSLKLRGVKEIGEFKGKIHHHSYRTSRQLFTKFTKYAWVAARQMKRQGETLSLAKLFFYGPHMFWARFVKEQGYRDGWRGLVLALAFGYMEGLTYWILLF